MTRTALRAAVGALFSSWSGGVRVFGPNIEAKFPVASNDVEAPNMIATWELEDETPSEDTANGLATFGGTEIMDGAVLVALWIEEDTGDLLLRTKADTLASTFRTKQAELTFYPMAEAGKFSGDNGFGATEYRIPYLRTHEP